LLDWTDAARKREVPVKVYAPKDGPGPFPIVVFSHGLGGSREGYGYLGRHWAGHGYVSVHPQHLGSDTAVIRGGPGGQRAAALDPAQWRERALDVSFTITKLEQANREDARFKGRLDADRIGVAGHSYGAHTTLAVIGQKLWMPGQGAQSFQDARVKAAIAMSASSRAGGPLGKQSFGAIRAPCLHMTGTLDVSELLATKAEDRRVPFDLSTATDTYLIIIKDAKHFAFSDNPFFPGLGLIQRVPEHHDYIRMASTAFWDGWLKGDPKARAWLAGGGFTKLVGEGATFEAKPRAPATPSPAQP
jgi:predicted dienelactone hydrolase